MICRSSSEEVELTLLQITRVGLADLRDVTEHRIEEHFGSVSHHVRFRNGGVLRFACAVTGNLLELSGEKLNIRLSPEGVIAIGPFELLVRQSSQA